MTGNSSFIPLNRCLRVLALILVLAPAAGGVLAGPAVSSAKPRPEQPSRPLLGQVQRLGELLGDGVSTWYRPATQVQTLALPPGAAQAGGATGARPSLTLALFTLEGFGGSNLYRQYLALFQPVRDRRGKVRYQLLDVVAAGGKGWREVERLGARLESPPAAAGEGATTNPALGELPPLVLSLPALGVGAADAPNFPSQPVTLRWLFQDGRLRELPAP